MSPAGFARKIDRLEWPAHLRLVSQLLVLVAAGRLPRLTMALPPGTAKSTAVFRTFPGWILDLWPKTKIIGASYSGALAIEHGKVVRATLEQHEQILRVRLKQDSKAANSWQTTDNGGLWTAGTGGTVTGRRAGLFIIDDPHAGFDDAHSAASRTAAINFATGTARTRLYPRSAMVVVACLAGDTPITLGDGRSVPISQVRAGDTVWGLADGRLERRRVIDQRRSGVDDTWRIGTDRASIVANRNHPFLVVPRNGSEFEWRNVEDLAVDDVLVTAAELDTQEPTPIPGWDTEERLWLLGFMFGDGWVTSWERKNYDKIRGRYYGSRSWAVCVALKVSEDLNQRVAAALEDAFGRRPKRLDDVRYWRLDHNAAGRTLEELGLTAGVRAPQKRIPAWVFGLPSALQRSFLTGLLAADGTRNRRALGRQLSSTSIGLAHDAARLGLLCGMRPTNVTVSSQTAQPPNSPAPLVVTSARVTLTGPEHDGRGASLIRGPLPEGLRLDRIRKIERSVTQDVYDLAVDGANFVAASFVVHNTRWHEEDLTGWIKANDHEGRWAHLRLPAIAEEDETIEVVLGPEACAKLRAQGCVLPAWTRKQGEALWPFNVDPETGRRIPWFDLEELASVRADLGSDYKWQSLYQQHPSAPEGEMFPVGKWDRADDVPAGVHLIRWWDLAATKDGGDQSVGALLCRDADGYVYIVDMVHGRWSATEVEKVLKATAVRDEERFGRRVETVIEQEGGSGGKAWAQRLVREVLAGHRARAEGATGDKTIRATGLAAQQQAGNVRLVRRVVDQVTGEKGPQSWFDPMIEESRGFPHGAHDDMVDAASSAYNALVGTGPRKARLSTAADRRIPGMG